MSANSQYCHNELYMTLSVIGGYFCFFPSECLTCTLQSKIDPFQNRTWEAGPSHLKSDHTRIPEHTCIILSVSVSVFDKKIINRSVVRYGGRIFIDSHQDYLHNVSKATIRMSHSSKTSKKIYTNQIIPKSVQKHLH